MRAERSLSVLVVDVEDSTPLINLPLADVFLTVLKISSQSHLLFTSLVRLCSHEEEDWLKDLVCQGLIVFAHTFPQIIHDVFDRNRTIGEDLASRNWNQLLVVRRTLVEGYVFQEIYLLSVFRARRQ